MSAQARGGPVSGGFERNDGASRAAEEAAASTTFGDDLACRHAGAD
jgi:hypothetical protein